MSWIDHTPPEKASGQLRSTYEEISAARNGVAELLLVQSNNHAALRAFWDLYRALILSDEGLSRVHKERIGVLIASHLGCTYLKRHHAEALRQMGEPASIRLALEEGKAPMELPEPERALLRWCVRSSQRPDSMLPDDLDDLRRVGYSDRQILDATLTVAFFHYAARIALLLGAELEPWFVATCGPADGA